MRKGIIAVRRQMTEVKWAGTVTKTGFDTSRESIQIMSASDSPFCSIWGRKERSYSGIIAQTFALSSEFRNCVLDRLARRFHERGCHRMAEQLQTATRSPADGITVCTEKPVEDGWLDIYVEFPEFAVSIENKKQAGLGPRQLLRYDRYLQGMEEPFVQVFLAPSHYRLLTLEEIPPAERFERVDYKDLIHWIRTDLRNLSSTFETQYYAALLGLFEELEEVEMPLTTEEVWAAQQDLRQTVDAKLENIVAKSGQRGEMEPINRNFILKYEEVGYWPVYRGIRRGTKWYFKEKLLKKQPEAIVYVKDIEEDLKRAKLLNVELSKIAQRTDFFKQLGVTPEYFPRNNANEARLVVRRPLSDFVGQELDNITEWLTNTFDVIRGVLEASETRPKRPEASQQSAI